VSSTAAITAEGVAKEFAALYGADPEGVWQAPGRVNLMGEHTDYNDGFSLPVALPYAARAAVRRRDDGVLRLHSAQAPQGTEGVVETTLDDLVPGSVTGWAASPAGVVWALRQAGHPVGGLDLHLDSDVPTGAGLSSSAALECATATALNDLYDLGLTPPELAVLSQRAENDYVGVPCGVMDQMASTCCTEGAALFLDARDLSQRQVPLALTAQGLTLLVIDTGVSHAHSDNEYAQRRAGCERAAALLDVRALRDLPYDGLDAALARIPEADAGLRPLVRHVVTDDARVEQVIALLDAGRLREIGPVLTAGHVSLRDDYEVSCAESDLVVETALANGALGARQTGGGFGGSIVILVESAAADTVAAAVAEAYTQRGYKEPRAFLAPPSAGAHRLS
jgi:galactokinase